MKEVHSGGRGISGRVAVRAFLIVILVGTAALMLPASSRAGHWTDPLTALFTAASASCVTGLSVVDIGTHYSAVGHFVILLLMQTGGLGVMTLATFLLFVVGRRLGMHDQIVLMDALGARRAFDLRGVLFETLRLAVLIESVGALGLALRLMSRHGEPVSEALYCGVFHAVSAFCNAGFGLRSDSLAGWRSDPAFLGIVMGLVVAGGLGFPVLNNLTAIRFWRRDRITKGRISQHARLAVQVSGLLILAGWAAFGAIEWHGVLRSQRVPGRLLTSLFQAVTPRTAGFSVVDMGAVAPATRYVTMGLMFIGGSPASTAGGIKTTTAAVLVAVCLAMLRGREDIELRRRRVADRVAREAITIFLIGVFCVASFFLLLLLAEHGASGAGGGPAPAEHLLFETVSAFGTVGLSAGITPKLSVVGKLLIVVLMLVGRLGPLTVALVVGGRDALQRTRLPEEEVLVG
jgi:potassium uptake TrkH family protein